MTATLDMPSNSAPMDYNDSDNDDFELPTSTNEEALSEQDINITLPDYRIAELWHQCFLPADDVSNPNELWLQLMELIEKNEMLPFYKQVCIQKEILPDSTIVNRLEKLNLKELESIEEKIQDAKSNYGDSEVRDAIVRKANYYCRIGEKNLAVEQYEIAFDKTVGFGGKIDIYLTLIRLGIFYNDSVMTKKYLKKANEAFEKGGDWERRNKLKVYEAILLMTCRQFNEASELFLESMAAFTASELLPFNSFIFYTVICSMLSLKRSTLREKVIESAEVFQVLSDDAILKHFLLSYYSCDYSNFMENLVLISKRLHQDRFLRKHYRYIIRNIRLKAYQQFLEPFESVKLDTMAVAFGVSQNFIESEVASFIASSKLSCKIDRVKSMIESNQPDTRNQLYTQTVAQGDILLNRLQKLSRIVDI